MSQFTSVFLTSVLSVAIVTVILALFHVSRGRFGAPNYTSHCPDAAGKTFKYLAYTLIALLVAGTTVLSQA